ncbi:hypothetical protein N658DRAFT_292312 [Parathielavia hyrcaniae]|uniref:Transmembrane protein n=1 Tax=Parathielavia hyrcaniae TaxID=113614 RepID=A0AAN6PXW8_9PEZI|nr:hypothetical protein N658DRAFT_292312 [Parathielavia hyrcaniae]
MKWLEWRALSVLGSVRGAIASAVGSVTWVLGFVERWDGMGWDGIPIIDASPNWLFVFRLFMIWFQVWFVDGHGAVFRKHHAIRLYVVLTVWIFLVGCFRVWWLTASWRRRYIFKV